MTNHIIIFCDDMELNYPPNYRLNQKRMSRSLSKEDSKKVRIYLRYLLKAHWQWNLHPDNFFFKNKKAKAKVIRDVLKQIEKIEGKLMQGNEIEDKLRQEKKIELYKTQRIFLSVIGPVLILISFLPLFLSYLTISKSSYTNFTFFNVIQQNNPYSAGIKIYFWCYFCTGILLLICGLTCIVRIFFSRTDKFINKVLNEKST